MKHNLLQSNEMKIYKGNAFICNEFDNTKHQVELILTNINLHLITRNENFEIINNDILNLENVKIYNNSPQIIHKDNSVEMYFIENEIFLEFTQKKDAKEFTNAALKLLTGKSKFVRMVDKTSKNINDTSKALHIDWKVIANGAKKIVEHKLSTTLNSSHSNSDNLIVIPNNNTISLPSNTANDNLDNTIEKLNKLKQLLNDNLITEEEYNLMKSNLLNNK